MPSKLCPHLILEGTRLARNGTDGPIPSAEFVIAGQRFLGYNGRPHFQFSEGFSLFVDCEDQQEVDEYWNKFMTAGATGSMSLTPFSRFRRLATPSPRPSPFKGEGAWIVTVIILVQLIDAVIMPARRDRVVVEFVSSMHLIHRLHGTARRAVAHV